MWITHHHQHNNNLQMYNNVGKYYVLKIITTCFLFGYSKKIYDMKLTSSQKIQIIFW